MAAGVSNSNIKVVPVDEEGDEGAPVVIDGGKDNEYSMDALASASNPHPSSAFRNLRSIDDTGCGLGAFDYEVNPPVDNNPNSNIRSKKIDRWDGIQQNQDPLHVSMPNANGIPEPLQVSTHYSYLLLCMPLVDCCVNQSKDSEEDRADATPLLLTATNLMKQASFKRGLPVL